MSYQSVLVPNGLIANLWGPAEGSANDSMVLARSQLVPRMREMNVHFGQEMCIYGDKGYPWSVEVQVPYKGNGIPQWQKNVNKIMSTARLAVEYGFMKVASDFSFCSFARNQRVSWMQNGKAYLVAAILSNCLTCLYKFSLVGNHFKLNPPSLEFYLNYEEPQMG